MYTEQFKKRVLAAYPNEPSLEDALEAGTYGSVAERLRIGSGETIDPMWVLEARTLAQVQQRAATIVMRNQVYEAFISEGNVLKASVPCKEQVHKELWDKPEDVTSTWQPRVLDGFLGYGES